MDGNEVVAGTDSPVSNTIRPMLGKSPDETNSSNTAGIAPSNNISVALNSGVDKANPSLPHDDADTRLSHHPSIRIDTASPDNLTFKWPLSIVSFQGG